MIATLKPLIKAKLDSITSLAFVYDYHNATPDGYPVASFEVARISNDAFDSCNNKIIYEFDIVIQQEIGELSTRSEARVLLDATIDEIIEEINKDTTLSDSCITSRIASIDCGNIILDKGEILYASLRMVCEILDFNN